MSWHTVIQSLLAWSCPAGGKKKKIPKHKTNILPITQKKDAHGNQKHETDQIMAILGGRIINFYLLKKMGKNVASESSTVTTQYRNTYNHGKHLFAVYGFTLRKKGPLAKVKI